MICMYLENATEQEVFDKVATHLLTQMKKATAQTGVCVYKAGELSCAAGCLIPDEEYDDVVENKNWGQLVRDCIVPRNHMGLIKILQRIHDSSVPSLWKELLKILAEREGLEFGNQLQQLPVTEESP